MIRRPLDIDVAVVGAGFAGLYMLHRLRELGLRARAFERGGDVGGTWFWNRYPGARCDIESVDYCYSFSPELLAGWTWTERYAAQPEILRYLQHVADRFDLRRDIQTGTRVTSLRYDEPGNRWLVFTDVGEVVSARHCVLAVGNLSSVKRPDFPGLDGFLGEWYQTARWPAGGVDFRGKRVGIVGTGSTAIQALPQIAGHVGANIPGKPRVFMPYVGGCGTYRRECEEVVERGYAGFILGAGGREPDLATPDPRHGGDR
jgi:cyclohexanone monooxygenase